MRVPALALVVLLATGLAAPVTGHAEDAYQAGYLRWRAAEGGFAGWTTSGSLLLPDGTLTLDPATAVPHQDAAGAYQGRNFYNGGPYVVGEASSAVTPTGFAFRRAVASWNAVTPPGTWIEVRIRAMRGGRLTKHYNLGVWASDGSTVSRHSVEGQKDDDGTVATDTLILSEGPPADHLELNVRFFSTRPDALPVLRQAAVSFTTPPVRPAPPTSAGDPARWNRILELPACTQRYPDGGDGWCSPTSTSMVTGFWTGDTGPCEPRVRAAVDGVFDWVYDGHGNWPFNTAYAAAVHGLDATVAHLDGGLADAEAWVAAGVPVIISYAWKGGNLPGAPVPSSDGHLSVIVGFDGAGNPVMHDTAAHSDAEVRRVYPRAELEARWLEHSGGASYLIHPPGHAVPPL